VGVKILWRDFLLGVGVGIFWRGVKDIEVLRRGAERDEWLFLLIMSSQ
jgi:hypothetical protein